MSLGLIRVLQRARESNQEGESNREKKKKKRKNEQEFGNTGEATTRGLRSRGDGGAEER